MENSTDTPGVHPNSNSPRSSIQDPTPSSPLSKIKPDDRHKEGSAQHTLPVKTREFAHADSFPSSPSTETPSFAIADSMSFNSNSFTAVSGGDRSTTTDASLRLLRIPIGLELDKEQTCESSPKASSGESSLDSFKAASPKSSPEGTDSYSKRRISDGKVASSVFAKVSATATSFETSSSSSPTRSINQSPSTKSDAGLDITSSSSTPICDVLSISTSPRHVQFDVIEEKEEELGPGISLPEVRIRDKAQRPTLTTVSSTATITSHTISTSHKDIPSRTSSNASSRAPSTTSSLAPSQSSSNLSTQSHPVQSRARARSGPLISRASTASLDGCRAPSEERSTRTDASALPAVTTASYRRSSVACGQTSHVLESSRPAEPSRADGRTTNVYINGLAPNTTENDLFSLCRAFGPIRSVRCFTRHVSGRASGYGFVLFETVESAEACIKQLRTSKNLHPSFSKQPHKIPGIKSDAPRGQYDEYTFERDGEDGEAEETFRARMAKLRDTKSTNLYIEGLPLSIDEPTLAALISPYKIQSSRFFQTRLSVPPRIICFARLESRAAAEEIIERLHGRMVRGWNDAGSRISVRFADTSDQRELRRTERTRDGDASPARLTIAQAALLNLRGPEMPRAPPPHFQHLPSPVATPASDIFYGHSPSQKYDPTRVFNTLRQTQGEENHAKGIDRQASRRGGFNRGRGRNGGEVPNQIPRARGQETPLSTGNLTEDAFHHAPSTHTIVHPSGRALSNVEPTRAGYSAHVRSVTFPRQPNTLPPYPANHLSNPAHIPANHYVQSLPQQTYDRSPFLYYSSPETEGSMSPSIVSPALSYTSSLRTPATMSPATPYFAGTFDPYQGYRAAAGYPVGK